MKFSVGDPVYIKSNNEEGVILEIIDAVTFRVRAGNATYHAFLEDLEHPYLRWFLDKSRKKNTTIFADQLIPEKPRGRQQVLPDGVYLVFFPIYHSAGFDESVEKIRIWLYNETHDHYRFRYEVQVKDAEGFELESELLPNSEFYIHDLAFERMANSPLFLYRFTDVPHPEKELEQRLSLKPKKFFQYLDAIRHDNKAFFHIRLFEDIPVPQAERTPISIPEFKAPAAPPKGHFDFDHALQHSRYEIDLHIEKLLPAHQRLDASEKLQVQLREFQKALDLAAVTRQRSIIFIHGVGKGRLKAELHKILSGLKQTKVIKDYVNNFDKRYGYGATEVYFP